MSHVTFPLAGIFGLGGTELIIILVIILLLFGGAKLPQLAKGLGQSVKEFKKASKDGEDEDDKKAPAKTDAASGNDTTKLRNN
jgi:sec-independent protein translocase protein TatA